MARPKKNNPDVKEWSFDCYTLTKDNGQYRIYAGKSLLYATDDVDKLDAMCRLIESRAK